ncbi:flagellar hook-associated protein FlgK [Nocardioides sp. QY071]|jgi:flagellar hook-associated protein 1 FlgK|uniref:flagellar hook-associated protein FlgK n=1 Tax=Nocardioides sp. QY071 TaxID=3044187 RepID=UPI00249B01A7|nr:flagellar hook-associated protein FlgK [Nocardioides sp. QY071]WGY01170.1 flagellar hook-associated protein FlgK [Nocardioides sp. QY071]
MVGSFGSINTALSGLRYNQVALDVAGNNIANAGTDGYVRRRVVGASVSSAQAALWSRYDGHGEGVAVGEVRRMTDPLLDSRVRREHGLLSYLSTSRTILARVEDGVGEPGPNGVHAAMLDLRNAWQDLSLNPGGTAARQQVLGRAETLAQALRGQVANVAGEEADQRVHATNLVSEVNTAASGLAALNHDILVTEQNGTDAGVLRDRRDVLATRLAELTGGVTTVQPDGQFTVTVAGTALVQGKEAGTFVLASGITPTGDADGSPISYRIDATWGSTVLPSGSAGPGGELGAVTEVLTTTLPAYRAGLDAVAADLAASVNAQQAAGFDASGAAGAPLFSYDPLVGAASLQVAITDPSKLAASSVGGGALDGANADLLSRVGTYPDAYQRLVNGLGTDVAALDRRTANQTSLSGALDDAREQQAGVNLDEETVNMVSAQRAYEAAARLMTTIDEVLDTLINRTGLVGR